MEAEIIKNEIRDLLEKMGFGGEIESIESHQGETSRFSVRMRNEANLLIGEQGHTLSSVEYMLKRILGKKYIQDSPSETSDPASPVQSSSRGGFRGFFSFGGRPVKNVQPDVSTDSDQAGSGDSLKMEKPVVKQSRGIAGGFTLDINDYRMKRLEDLKQDVKSAAKEVRMYRKNVPLRFMSSFERRIVHLLLAEYPDIATESVGQEPLRRVVIKPYP